MSLPDHPGLPHLALAQGPTLAHVLSATAPVKLQQCQAPTPHSSVQPWDPLSQAKSWIPSMGRCFGLCLPQFCASGWGGGTGDSPGWWGPILTDLREPDVELCGKPLPPKLSEIVVSRYSSHISKSICEAVLASRRKGLLMVEMLCFRKKEQHSWWKQMLECANYLTFIVVCSLSWMTLWCVVSQKCRRIKRDIFSHQLSTMKCRFIAFLPWR